MIKYIRLKQQFDAARMQEEVKALESAMWNPHYNKKHYEGDWSALPFRSINGMPDNCVSVHHASLQKDIVYQDTQFLNHCGYIRSVIDFFECEKMSVRLMKLNAGACIKEHTDYNMHFEEGEARFHIPILTNTGVDFFIEDEKIPLQEGDCWYLNLSLKHRVNNFGNTHRIHLVIDCKVNDWVSNLLTRQDGLRSDHIPAPINNKYDDADKANIIKQLRLMATPVSIELANKIESDNN